MLLLEAEGQVFHHQATKPLFDRGNSLPDMIRNNIYNTTEQSP